MKKQYCLLVATLFALVCTPAYAGDEWQKIFQDLSTGREIKPGQAQEASLYNSKIDFTISDNNNFSNDFNNNDTISFTIKGNGQSLKLENATKEEVIAWADSNRNALFKAVFGNAPDAAISGMTANQALTQQLFSSTLSSPENNGTSFIPVSNKDIFLNAQFDFMEIDKDDATGNSGLLSYSSTIGENRDMSAGVTIPYRKLDLDDRLDSQYSHIAALPHFKKRFYLEQSLVELSIHAIIGLTYLESSLFPDGGGYLDYGAGTAVKYAYAFNDQLSVNTGLAYQLSKRNIPSDLVPDEIKWVADALNDADPEHDLIPSLGVFYSIIPGKLSFRGELFRIHQLQSDAISDYKNQTVAMGSFAFSVYKNARMAIGYKRSFEMKDITDQSLIFDFKLGW